MSEPIIVTDPISTDMSIGALRDWLEWYQMIQHPSSPPSVFPTSQSFPVELLYRISDCWIYLYLEPTMETPGKVTITKMTCSPYSWKGYFEKLVEALRQLSLIPRQKPPHPPLRAPPDSWFDWYHVVTDELGYKMSLEDLAIEMGLSYGRVRHLHADYMEEHREIEETETAQK